MKEDYSIYDDMIDADSSIIESLAGFTIETIGMTSGVERHYFDDSGEEDVYKSTVEGGLTLILSKGNLRKKVILGYTELGEWIENDFIL